LQRHTGIRYKGEPLLLIQKIKKIREHHGPRGCHTDFASAKRVLKHQVMELILENDRKVACMLNCMKILIAMM
jgi:hypothetical protein